MNDFAKRLLACWSVGQYDLDKNCAVTQEIEDLYKKRLRKAKIECYLRLAAAVAIIVYGALGIKYNTGWYVTWALFTAIVGVNAAMVIILCILRKLVGELPMSRSGSRSLKWPMIPFGGRSSILRPQNTSEGYLGRFGGKLAGQNHSILASRVV